MLALSRKKSPHAVTTLSRCLTLYGRDTLITALQCITQTADGNAGFVRATIIEALCEVLHQSPEWREAGEQPLRTMDKFKFADTWDQIAADRDRMFPSTASKMMADPDQEVPLSPARTRRSQRSSLIEGQGGVGLSCLGLVRIMLDSECPLLRACTRSHRRSAGRAGKVDGGKIVHHRIHHIVGGDVRAKQC
jgi:hypothetical protein